MPGPAPKPKVKRQRAKSHARPEVGDIGRKADLRSVDGAKVVPTAPPGLSVGGKTLWKEFWASPLAEIVDVRTDLPALRRLFGLRDEQVRLAKVADKTPTVQGSTGQPVMNPLYKRVNELDSKINQLEDRFGFTPMARLKLGITFAEGTKSWEELNASLAASRADDEAPARRADPRLAAVPESPQDP